jgi:hypothetical protein
MDDYTAIPPLVFDIINIIVIWMMYVEKGEGVLVTSRQTQSKDPIDFRKGLEQGRALLAYLNTLVHNNLVRLLLRPLSVLSNRNPCF